MAEEKQVEQTTTPVVEEQPTEQPTETVNANTFSEEDVNNIVKQRLAKERASIYKKLDVEDLETAIQAVQNQKQAEEKTRIIVRAATTANVNLSNALENGDTLDGISLATGNKVLVKNQSDATENGIYVVPASGAASRDPDFNTVDELAGQLVIIQEGTTNEDTIFLCTTDTGGTIGSVNITFSQVQPQFTGTVSSVAVADAGSSEFTVTGSPITTSGTINLAVNNINVSKITDAASKGFATAMAIAL